MVTFLLILSLIAGICVERDERCNVMRECRKYGAEFRHVPERTTFIFFHFKFLFKFSIYSSFCELEQTSGLYLEDNALENYEIGLKLNTFIHFINRSERDFTSQRARVKRVTQASSSGRFEVNISRLS
jgi:hypothetical protein